jgi:hypothetical protein
MELLIKAYEFAWEAAKFTWKNLEIGILLVLVPCMISVISAQHFGINQIDHPIMYFALVDLLLPLWAVGWLRYVIAQKAPTLKSCLVVDQTFFMFLLYSFVVAAPLYIYEYLNHLVEFNALKDVIQLKVGIPMQMDPAILQSYGVGFVTLILLSLLLLPLFFIFPAVVDKKPYPLLRSWERVKPFYAQYTVSYALLLVIACVFVTVVLGAVQLLSWYLGAMGRIYHLEFITNWPLWSLLGHGGLLMVLLQYVAGLYLFALVGLYYKKYLSKSKKIKARARKAEPAPAPALQPTNPF